ncbi:hypothetical protein Rsub_09777 [Raphidocelis subcapitata]|uniref:DUF7794 domain-containing protein n=1 Tax=Raphidocelis subcapitata TaxID=307507 RepID=A0A2V0PGE6_9CHLO|nr:hypothetical protein Rsub_09777 [Raphidocelis subcapitata]|eukprot:GBF96980.1 hypothetical protein Rsub_09777 [Raphidocelis subcapitata]
MARPLLAVLLVAGCLACAGASHLLVHDCSHRHLDHPGQQADLVLAGPGVAAGLTAALAGLLPPQPLDREAAQQVGSLVKSSVFDRPAAVVLLNIAGASPDDGTLDTLATALPDGSSLRARVAAGAGAGSAPADAVLSALAAVAGANPDVAFERLDASALKGCGAACLEGHLHDAAQRFGGVLEPRGDDASLQLPSGGALPLASAAARLFADELGALHGAARSKLRARADARRQQRAAREGAGDDVAVFHGTLVGLQALRASGAPRADADLAAAAEALAGVLRELAAEAERAYGADVVYQITMLGDAPAAAAGEAEGEGAGEQGPDGAEGREASLLTWRRRALLQFDPSPAPTPAPSGPAAAKAFAAKATSYGVALLLIYITAAVLFAMVSMPFKQDTLLWGRPKASTE